MYRAFLCKSHTGIVFSISLSCAILSQYFLQSYTKSYNITLYSLMLITFIAAFINLSGVTDTLTDTAQDDYFDSKSDNKHFITVFISMIFIIILFEYIGNFLSYSLFSLMYDGKALVYDTPRLFIIISYIIMGIFADIKDMKYIPVITLTGVIISILNPVLMHENSSLYANTCIYYIVAGIINSFFTLMMLKLARGRRFAPLIAVSGRIVDGIFSFIFISPIMSNIPIFYAVGIELLCIMVIMLLLAFTGQLSFITNEPDIVAHISPSDFSEKFKLSEKESEVFITALSFDGTMSELAKSLFMSRSVLYRNISNICYKTECDSFQAVKRLYYELPANTQANINTTEIKEQKNDNHTIDKIMSTDNDNLDQNDDDTSFAERMSSFVDKYSLTVKEMQTLKAFLENPYKTQKELADMQGVTLRTIQRHLANIKTKTNVNSFDELSSLFYSS
ncbi:MAG: hypothetical protein IJV15_02410 [Lachnospiraceae bacterium]|nr:hypothetical protein [Lachnospiraceae bacterium]